MGLGAEDEDGDGACWRLRVRGRRRLGCGKVGGGRLRADVEGQSWAR